MAYLYRVWKEPLSAYVNYLWVAEGYVQPHAREFVLPTASLTLIIDLDVEKADGILICGARSQPLVLGTAKPLRLMAAVFKPGCGFPFAGCPAGELQNLQVPLSAFWPSETADLSEHLFEAPTNFERFRVLERFLTRRVRASRRYHPAIHYAIRQLQYGGAASSVAGVRDQVGDFRQFAGVTPSAYLRHRTARNHVRIAD